MSDPVRLDPWTNIVEVGWPSAFWLVFDSFVSNRRGTPTDTISFSFLPGEAITVKGGSQSFTVDGAVIVEYVESVTGGSDYSYTNSVLVNLSSVRKISPLGFSANFAFEPPYVDGLLYLQMRLRASSFRGDHDLWFDGSQPREDDLDSYRGYISPPVLTAPPDCIWTFDFAAAAGSRLSVADA